MSFKTTTFSRPLATVRLQIHIHVHIIDGQAYPNKNNNKESLHFTGNLMRYVRAKLKEERLLELMSGNPRSLKRICNIITLALSCYPKPDISREEAFYLLLVVIMVEQWPFRYVELAARRH